MSGLARLRLGFVMLGALLLLPLFLLLREAEARFEFQRRLRHEIVAERVFDEMERELTALLEHERARPSSAYDNPKTQVDRWSPFVVGYFRYDRQRLHLPAASQLSAERKARVVAAVQHAEASGELLALLDGTDKDRNGARDDLATSDLAGDSKNADQPLGSERAIHAQKRVSQAAVLRQLNRAQSSRAGKESKLKARPRMKPSKRKTAPKADRKLEGLEANDDPLRGL